MNLTAVMITLIICITLVVLTKEIADIYKTINQIELNRSFRYWHLFKPIGKRIEEGEE